MSEHVNIPTPIFTSTTQNCFDGIDVSVNLLGLERNKDYRLTVVPLLSEGGLSDDQPTMLLFPSTGSTEAALPASLPSFTASSSVTSKDFTYKIRLQNDSLYKFGYKLEKKNRGASDSTYELTGKTSGTPNGNGPNVYTFFVQCDSVVPFLTPTPTVTEIAQIDLFNLNEVLEKGEVVFELRGDSFVEVELPVSLDSGGKVYIRKPGEDLIKVVEINSDLDAEVTDYLIVPSPTPTLTQTVTNTSTPTPTPIDVFQKTPFSLSFDTINNKVTCSVSTAFLKPPASNTDGSVNSIEINFNNVKLVTGNPIVVSEPDITTGLFLNPSLVGDQGFLIANNTALFNISDVDKIKFTIGYDPASTNTATASIKNFKITDRDAEYTLKDMAFKLNNDGTLSNIISLFNFIPPGSDTTIAGGQIDLNNQITLTPSSIISTFPASLNDGGFQICDNGSSNIVFAGGSITFDKESFLEVITEFNAASSNLNNAAPLNILLADGNNNQYTNVYSTS